MKTKSIFFSVILASALFLQLNAQTVEKQVNESPGKAVANPESIAQTEPGATIAFDKYKHDFGIIKESNGKVSVVFTFTNKSDSSLLISKVTTSCGCTAPEWSREPVAPGGQGFIKAIYDPANRTSFFNKSLTVYSNGNPSKVELSIQGTSTK